MTVSTPSASRRIGVATDCFLNEDNLRIRICPRPMVRLPPHPADRSSCRLCTQQSRSFTPSSQRKVAACGWLFNTAAAPSSSPSGSHASSTNGFDVSLEVGRVSAPSSSLTVGVVVPSESVSSSPMLRLPASRRQSWQRRSRAQAPQTRYLQEEIELQAVVPQGNSTLRYKHSIVIFRVRVAMETSWVLRKHNQ